MDAKYFKQNMSHADAMSYDLGLSGLNGGQAISSLAGHYGGLGSRPDYDGWVTNKEAQSWWSKGNGEPLFVDMSNFTRELNPWTLEGLFGRDGNGVLNTSVKPNFFFRPSASDNLGRVYGSLHLDIANQATGEITIGKPSRSLIDRYDFESHPGETARNIATWWGRNVVLDDGKKFDFIGYGSNPRMRTN